MATEVVMPQMGESIAEGTITRWLVKVGDKVERDQPLFEISTDKVDAEIPSPAAGTLLEVRHQEGETVPVNQVVALIGESGEQPAAAASREAEPPPEPPSVADQKEADEPPPPPKAAAPTAAEPEAAPAAEAGGGVVSLEDRVRKFSSPLVRSIAAKEGVNLEDVEGTGAHGRVTKQDKCQQRRGARPFCDSAQAASPLHLVRPK